MESFLRNSWDLPTGAFGTFVITPPKSLYKMCIFIKRNTISVAVIYIKICTCWKNNFDITQPSKVGQVTNWGSYGAGYLSVHSVGVSSKPKFPGVVGLRRWRCSKSTTIPVALKLSQPLQWSIYDLNRGNAWRMGQGFSDHRIAASFVHRSQVKWTDRDAGEWASSRTLVSSLLVAAHAAAFIGGSHFPPLLNDIQTFRAPGHSIRPITYTGNLLTCTTWPSSVRPVLGFCATVQN